MVDPETRSTDVPGPTADPVAATHTDLRDPAEASGSGSRSGLHIPGYELEGEIGRGGMGVVYRARDLSLSRDLAIKVLQTKYSTGSYAAVRFLEEARITAQLQHPGVPPIHAVGTLADGRPFLAMKLIKGRTLDEILNDPLTANRGLLIPAFEQICQAVAYAHNHGVIHRDLKPHNVMVGAFGEIQVMDWGLAKFRSEMRAASAQTSVASTFYDPRDESDENSKTRAGSFLGTPAYMSPEQALGAVDRIDERSDVFGLGAVLCTILTGHPPFLGETAEATRLLAAQGKLDVAFAGLESCGAERELVDLCKQCLATDPSARPANAGVVAKAVADFRAAAEVRARQAELDRVKAEGNRAAADLKAAEQRKRRKMQMALGLAFTALLVLSMAFAWWRDRQASERRAEQAAANSRAEQAVDSAVTLAVTMRDKYRFKEAALALDQAEALIPPDAPESIRSRLAAARDDLEFVRTLDAIRISRILSNFLTGIRVADAAYAAAFLKRGIDPTGEDSNAIGDRVAASPIRQHLILALDDWSWFAVDQSIRPRILALIRRADPGPWSDRLRDEPIRWNQVAIEKVASEADPRTTPVNQIVLLFQIRPKAWPGAEELLQQAVLRNPSDFWIQFEAGFFYHGKLPRPSHAIAHFEAARALRPDLPLVVQLLGEAYGKAGRRREAVECYREVVRLDGTIVSGHLRLADSLRARQDYSEAIEEYRAAIRLDPDNAAAQSMLGQTLLQNRDLEEAFLTLTEAIRLAPFDAVPHYNLSYPLQAKGQLERAIAELRLATRLDPKLAVAFAKLGDVLLECGEFGEALMSYREAIRLFAIDAAAGRDVNWWMAHSNNMCAWTLATGPMSLRNGKLAIEMATRACELQSWENPDCLDTLAAAYAETGDFAKAVETEKRALKFPDAKIHRGGDACRARLELYLRKMPFRALPPAPAPRPVVR